jgi:hypothetical protein
MPKDETNIHFQILKQHDESACKDCVYKDKKCDPLLPLSDRTGSYILECRNRTTKLDYEKKKPEETSPFSYPVEKGQEILF